MTDIYQMNHFDDTNLKKKMKTNLFYNVPSFYTCLHFCFYSTVLKSDF